MKTQPDFVVDRSLYPFDSHYHDTPEGRMHYVDEGSGPAILFVHGTPTWSFLFRDLLATFARHHRVVAVDHLGFGLSEKPAGAEYRPEDHARRLAGLMEHLGLRDMTLVVHDFGGPIGLSYAIAHPDRVLRLVVFNTWLWSQAADPGTVRVSRLLGGSLGRFLYTRLNLSPRVLLRMGFADRSRLTADVHRHYLGVFPTPENRVAPWVLARELIGSSVWYDELWSRRARLRDKPMLIVWGMKDPAFTPRFLRKWGEAFPDADVVTLPDAGHFVTEEASGEVANAVERFLSSPTNRAVTAGA
jgi:haloalkane dehalogenase